MKYCVLWCQHLSNKKGQIVIMKRKTIRLINAISDKFVSLTLKWFNVIKISN